MKKLIQYGNEYAKQSDWKDFALVKLCLAAAGMLWGLAMPKKARKAAGFTAVIVFVVTYLPLMLKFFRVVEESKPIEKQ